MELNVQRHFKCWLWSLSSLLWAGHKFNCDITELRDFRSTDFWEVNKNCHEKSQRLNCKQKYKNKHNELVYIINK